MITPSLIFLMLFVTFCRVKPSQMKPSMLHVWLLLFQVVVSAALYFAVAAARCDRGAGGDDLRAGSRGDGRGGDCRACWGPTFRRWRPTACVCNMAIAFDRARRAFAGRNRGLLFHADTGPHRAAADHALRGGAVLPFSCCPKTAKWIGDHSQISFYMWLASLVVIIGRTTAFIIDLHDASLSVELWLAFAALAICLVQFKVGRIARPPLRGRAGGRAVARAEEHGAGRLDGAVVPRPDLLDRPDGLYRVAELRQFLPDMEKGQRKSNKLIVKN